MFFFKSLAIFAVWLPAGLFVTPSLLKYFGVIL